MVRKLSLICLMVLIIITLGIISIGLSSSLNPEIFNIILDDSTLTKIDDEMKYNIVWEKTFGGTEDDLARSIVETADGGFLFVANTKSFGNGNNDILVIKIDSNGIEQWNLTFGTVNEDIPSRVIKTIDGGFLITGTSTNSNSDSTKGFFAKISTDGILEWNKTLGISTNNQIGSIIKTSEGGYLLVGVTNSFDTSPNMWLIKTDETGSEIWNKTYGGLSFQRAWDAVNSNDGGFVMIGWTGSHSGIEILNDLWLLKTDNNGNELWNRSFGEKYTGELGEKIIETSDGGFLLGGTIDSSRISSGLNDAWIIKTDSKGIEEWNRTYGGTGQDYTNALLERSDGGYIVSIHTYSYPYTTGDNLVIKINNNGTQEWNQSYGYSQGDDFAFDMIPTTDNGYVLAGRTQSIGAGKSDIWVLKIHLNEDSTNSSDKNSTPSFTVFMLLLSVSVIYLKKRIKRNKN